MKTTILDVFNAMPYFTIEGAKQVFSESGLSIDTVHISLFRWIKAGKLIQLKKGVYMPRLFFELYHDEPHFLAAVSAILKPQSYISLETVLQQHNILTEITYPVTSVTTKNTATVENGLGTFTFRHLKPSLYRGYFVVDFHGIPIVEAYLPKALFDSLYLRPGSGVFPSTDYDLAGELRLNLDEFSPEDRNAFTEYVHSGHSKKMETILKNFQRTVWRT
jgi:hypothetical protein